MLQFKAAVCIPSVSTSRSLCSTACIMSIHAHKTDTLINNTVFLLVLCEVFVLMLLTAGRLRTASAVTAAAGDQHHYSTYHET